MNKKTLIISGDPNSINSEIIYKCWRKLSLNTRKNIYLISNFNLLEKQFKKLKYSIKLIKVKNLNDQNNSHYLKVIDVKLKFKNPFKVSYKSSSNFIKETFNLAHNIALKENVKGIINCPIDKNLLKKNNQGITEYLASKCKIKNGSEVMLIRNERLSVTPITTHLNLRNIFRKINSKLITKKVCTINNWFKKNYNRKPKIAILGLNPHNGELKRNTEEVRIIIPAINQLKKIGVRTKGPMVADTFFVKEYMNYDVVVGMYHDQVLAPFKTIFKFDAINITLGLKYLRLSPDHGVAKNIIMKNKANHTSLLKCIEFLKKFK